MGLRPAVFDVIAAEQLYAFAVSINWPMQLRGQPANPARMRSAHLCWPKGGHYIAKIRHGRGDAERPMDVER